MKKILIIGGLILTITIIIVSYSCSRSVKAEETPPTPAFSGDFFINKTLYLFNDYYSTPNFENGYRAKKTIGYEDFTNEELYGDYVGWYNRLGQSLVDTEDNEPYFDSLEWWLYIPLNNMLGKYFQLGVNADITRSLEFYIHFTDGTYLYWDSSQELNNNFIIITTQSKQETPIDFFCWSVAPPDYYGSFRTLTSQTAYDFGYYTGQLWGFEEGYNNGYNTGYNTGYSEGYQEGVNDNMTYGVNTVLNFNQLTQNPLLENITPFLWTNSFTRTFQDNGYLKLTPGSSGNSWALVQNTPVISGNIYLFVYDVYKSPTSTNCFILPTDNNGNLGNYAIPTTEGQKTPIFFNVSDSQLNITKRLYAYGDNVEIYIKSCLCFNLTQIYGSGNEPTTYEDFIQDFPSDYYPYITTQLINIDYQNGFIEGKNEGTQEGIAQGITIGETHTFSVTDWIMGIFTAFGSFLSIQILPGVTIGLIIGIPFLISLAWFVIRMYRGGGGD